jgi:hypothetical protein
MTMRVKALKTLGGAVVAQAGEEFEITNEAQLRDLLNQGVVVPVESNPQEVSKVQTLGGEQLAEARKQLTEQEQLNSLAYAEAVQHASNQQVDELEQKRKQASEQARQQADQKAQHAFQQEQQLREAEAQVEQMRLKVRQDQAIQKAQLQNQSAQRNSQPQAQSHEDKKQK